MAVWSPKKGTCPSRMALWRARSTRAWRTMRVATWLCNRRLWMAPLGSVASRCFLHCAADPCQCFLRACTCFAGLTMHVLFCVLRLCLGARRSQVRARMEVRCTVGTTTRDDALRVGTRRLQRCLTMRPHGFAGVHRGWWRCGGISV